MARALGEALEAEERDELPEPDEFRHPNAFELAQLEMDPTLPIYGLRLSIRLAHAVWYCGLMRRSRAVPVTCSREFVRSEGHPYDT